MYLEKTIAVVVPAYNEEKLINQTLNSIPALVDKIIVVNDASTDTTAQIVKKRAKEGHRICFLEHEANQGVGGAIATGYEKARDMKIDVTVVMAGDAQMDPRDFIHIIEPVANGRADYTKGNRLFYGDAWNMIPRYRYLVNSFLSLLTKMASGYWHIADSQSGYTAISLLALQRIELSKIYKHYGMPFYILSFILLCSSIALAIRLFYFWAVMGDMPDMTAMALVFTLISGLQTLFFGMWFDMEYNKDLK
jgi:glycosyltransferase involved in cell wall biosynthesis